MAKKPQAEARTGQKVLTRTPATYPARIVPYFAVVVPLPELAGHWFFGHTPDIALANARRRLAELHPESLVDLDIENPELIDSWKEPVFD